MSFLLPRVIQIHQDTPVPSLFTEVAKRGLEATLASRAFQVVLHLKAGKDKYHAVECMSKLDNCISSSNQTSILM